MDENPSPNYSSSRPPSLGLEGEINRARLFKLQLSYLKYLYKTMIKLA